jgi:hypothetical protein
MLKHVNTLALDDNKQLVISNSWHSEPSLMTRPPPQSFDEEVALDSSKVLSARANDVKALLKRGAAFEGLCLPAAALNGYNNVQRSFGNNTQPKPSALQTLTKSFSPADVLAQRSFATLNGNGIDEEIRAVNREIRENKDEIQIYVLKGVDNLTVKEYDRMQYLEKQNTILTDLGRSYFSWEAI